MAYGQDDVRRRPPKMNMTPVVALDVEKVEFQQHRMFAAGYDEEQVDVFLDRVWWTLRRVELTQQLALGLVTNVVAHLRIAKDAKWPNEVTQHSLDRALTRLEELTGTLSWLTTADPVPPTSPGSSSTDGPSPDTGGK